MGAGYRKGMSSVELCVLELCTKYGFCLSPDDQAAMIAMRTDDLDAWAKEVFRREGLGEPLPKDPLWRQVRAHVELRLSAS